jgi:hypothetical protein
MILIRIFLYIGILSSRIYRLFRSPLTWWESRVAAKRAHELSLVQLQLQAQSGMVAAMADLMKGSLESVAQATTAQQNLFTTWLESFKTTDVPVASTIRESDEILAARDRELDYLRSNGIQVSLTPFDTVEWMNEQVGAEQALTKLGVDVASLQRHLQ